MRTAGPNVLVILCILATIKCNPFDDGKYNPKKYKIYDDGKYYRPLGEGKYIPGDEGRYTYVYTQGLYPTDTGDYRYIHKEGPNGGKGGNGGYGGNGGMGGNGAGGGEGGEGTEGSQTIEYIGRRNYAERFPYIHKVIKALVDKYVSTDKIFGDTSGNTVNYYDRAYAENEVSVKCKYLMPEKANETEFVTQYPPRLNLDDGEKMESFYSFKGTKVLNTVNSTVFTNKIKVKYEVYIRVVQDETENV